MTGNYPYSYILVAVDVFVVCVKLSLLTSIFRTHRKIYGGIIFLQFPLGFMLAEGVFSWIFHVHQSLKNIFDEVLLHIFSTVMCKFHKRLLKIFFRNICVNFNRSTSEGTKSRPL